MCFLSVKKMLKFFPAARVTQSVQGLFFYLSDSFPGYIESLSNFFEGVFGVFADTEAQAVADYYPSATIVMNRIGRERGWSPITQQQLEGSRTLRGADFVGTPQQFIEKILFQHEIFGHQRLLLQLGIGTIEHSKVMRAIELLGTEVAPVVRREIARK